MMTLNDFSKKQIVFVMCNDGEKMAISNDNLVVKNPDGMIYQMIKKEIDLISILKSSVINYSIQYMKLKTVIGY